MADLRWATREDLQHVVGLVSQYHRQEGFKGHSEERLQSVLEDLFEAPRQGRILLAEEAGEPVGYALVVLRPSFEWASQVLVLDEIFVRGRAREHGLGRRMIRFVEDYAATEKLPNITLEVSVTNVAARGFYRAVGFERVDREIYARSISGPR